MSKTLGKTNNIIGLRIAQVRKQNSLTQEEFATKLSEYMQRKRSFSISGISSWEVGRKQPPTEVVMAIAELFNVSPQYLLGTENEELKPGAGIATSTAIAFTPEIRKIEDMRILPSDYEQYHGKAVFVVFKNMEHKSQWGLLNAREKYIVLLDQKRYALDANIELYPLESYDFPSFNGRRAKPISAARFQTLTGRFWVEIVSGDDEVRAAYNGWYIFNKNRTAIINIANGLTLSPRNFSLSYKCFTEPLDVAVASFTN